MKWLLAAILSLISSYASAQVTFDTTSSTAAQCVGTTTCTLSTLTVGSGSNRALVAGLCYSNGGAADPVISVTWNSVNLTQIVASDTAGASGHCEIWALLNPASGNFNLVLTLTTSNNSVLGATAFAGVNQTGGATSFSSTSATGTGANPTVTISSATGNFTMDVMGTTQVASAPTQTQNWVNACCSVGGNSSRATGAASVVFGWTAVASNWADLAIEVKAATAAGGNTTLMTTGVGN